MKYDLKLELITFLPNKLSGSGFFFFLLEPSTSTDQRLSEPNHPRHLRASVHPTKLENTEQKIETKENTYIHSKVQLIRMIRPW